MKENSRLRYFELLRVSATYQDFLNYVLRLVFIFIGMGNLNCTSEKNSGEKYDTFKSSKRRYILFEKVGKYDYNVG